MGSARCVHPRSAREAEGGGDERAAVLPGELEEPLEHLKEEDKQEEEAVAVVRAGGERRGAKGRGGGEEKVRQRMGGGGAVPSGRWRRWRHRRVR